MAIERKSCWVITDDGVRISFNHYHCIGRDAAIIVCHGFFKSKETRTFQNLSEALAGGWDVICMDFRGHGRSGGLFTFSAREHADLEAVLCWAEKHYANLGILGFSLGAATAINTVSRNPGRIKSLISVSGPYAFEEVEFKFWTPEAIRRGILALRSGAGCRPGNPLLKKVRPIDSLRTLQQVPILFIHGTRDVIVDVRHSRRLFEAATTTKHLEIIERGSHAEALFQDEPGRFVHLVSEWYAQTLAPKTPSVSN